MTTVRSESGLNALLKMVSGEICRPDHSTVRQRGEILYGDIQRLCGCGVGQQFYNRFFASHGCKKSDEAGDTKGRNISGQHGGSFLRAGCDHFSLSCFFLQSIVTYCAASALMTALAFKFKDLRALLRIVAGLYLSAVILAGLMELFRAGGFYTSIYLYAAAVGFSIILTLYLWRMVSESAAGNGHLYKVLIEYQGREASFTGFLDTGNRLTEPYTGNPVSVISAASCTELFGTVNAVIFVPFRSVGKDSGILPAVRADRMEIEKDGQKKIIDKPYIAISEEKLSQNDSYQILLNEKLWV